MQKPQKPTPMDQFILAVAFEDHRALETTWAQLVEQDTKPVDRGGRIAPHVGKLTKTWAWG